MSCYVPPSDPLFYVCYDCGYGEKSVSAGPLSSKEIYEKVLILAGLEKAEKWLKSSWEEEFEINTTHVVIPEKLYDPQEWEGDPLSI